MLTWGWEVPTLIYSLHTRPGAGSLPEVSPSSSAIATGYDSPDEATTLVEVMKSVTVTKESAASIVPVKGQR